MTTNSTTPAKAGKPKTPAKVSHAKAKPAQELPTISAVKLVPLAAIDIAPQVRTVFDEASIRELADDIGQRGLLQPVLLNPNGDRFTLIAGERRVRACRLLELTDVPALITKASQADALLMQLAENIQRENLDLKDEVNAIRLLHDSLKSVQAVADTVKKSPAWVSKRLALSHEDLSWEARRLMEDGITEDVEILNCLSSLFAISYGKGNELSSAIRAGTATRETARQALKKAKTAKKEAAGSASTLNPAERERIEEEQKRLAEERRKEREEGTGEAFIRWSWDKLNTACQEPDQDTKFEAAQFFEALHHNQKVALRRHTAKLEKLYADMNLPQWAEHLNYNNSDFIDYLQYMIGIATLKGQHPSEDFAAFLVIIEGANREVE